MSLEPNEIILRKERIAKGIFAIPALVLVLFLIPDVFLLWIVSQFTKVLSSFGPHAASNPVLSYSLVFLLLVSFVPALTVLAGAWLAYLKSEITLTNKWLIFRGGYLMRISGELPLQNIEAIYLIEPLLGRWFGYGTIVVTGVGGARFPLRYIGQPRVFHAALQKAVSKRTPVQPQVKASDDSRYMPKG